MHASLLVRTHEAPGVGADQGSGLFFFVRSVSSWSQEVEDKAL